MLLIPTFNFTSGFDYEASLFTDTEASLPDTECSLFNEAILFTDICSID